MLYRVIAPMNCGKKDLLLREAKKALEEKKKIYLVVPEQATAEYERALLTLFPQAGLTAEVTNFSRLPNIVLRTIGHLQEKPLAEMEKKLLLYECVNEKEAALSHCNLHQNPQALHALYQELEEFRLAGISFDSLKEMENQKETGEILKEKLEEFSLISSAFQEKIRENGRSSHDELEHLANILADHPFFQDAHVFIDGFWDFTAPQEKLLRRILCQAEKVWISFTADKNKKNLFAKSLRAARRCLRMAREMNVEVRDEILPLAKQDSDLDFLKAHLLSPATPRQNAPETIRITACRDAVQEVSYVTGQIQALAQKGVKWNEIAVLSRSGERDELLSLFLEAENIPFFAEEKKPISASALAKTLLLGTTIACGNATEEEYRRYLSSAMLNLPEEDLFLLEKYFATWGLSGKVFFKTTPFSMNPEGYQEFQPEDQVHLNRINAVKEKAFIPLRHLAMGISAGAVEEKVAALVAFLQEIGAEKLFQEKISRARTHGDYQHAGALVRTWNTVLEQISSLARALGKKECSGKYFLDLLTIALSGDLPGSLPPGQDRVFLGNVAFARPEQAKFIFLMGMNADSFPKKEKRSGILSPSERETLRELGYPLSCGIEAQYDEFFYFYLALSYAKEGIFLSYLTEKESQTENNAVSIFIKRTLTLFPQLKISLFKPEEEIPKSRGEIFRWWLRNLKREEAVIEELSEYFLLLPEYREKVLQSAGAMAFRDGKRRLAAPIFQGNHLSTSYSRLEKYTNCPYSYFAQYHLQAKKSGKATFGANLIGSFVHTVLERVLKEIALADKNLKDIPEEELKEICSRICLEHRKAILPEKETARIRYLMGQVTSSCFFLLKHLKKEFSQSLFRPAYFELDLKDLKDGYRIPLPDGKTILLHGKIDRVDLYENPQGKQFVRVVDYKSGGHDFDLTAVANGLDLQMLLYLFAIWDKGLPDSAAPSPSPAGIIYVNGMEAGLDCQSPQEEQNYRQDPFQGLSRKGFVVEDEELLRAQDAKGMGEFIPVAWNNPKSRKKNGLISQEKLGKLKKTVERNLEKLVQQMNEGDISPLPLCKKRSDGPCTYCEFKPICKRDPNRKKAYREKIDPEELFTEEKNDGAL